MRGSLLGEFKELDCAREVAFLFLQVREVDGDLTELEEIGFLISGLLLAPLAKGQTPDLPGTSRVVVVLVVKPAQFEEDVVAVGVVEESFPQKALGFLDLAEI